LNFTVKQEQDKYNGDDEQKGHLSLNDLPMDRHGSDCCPNTENERDIANVGPNNVSESDVALGRIQEICLQADQELWRTCSKGYDRKSHHQRGYPHHERDLPGPLNKPFSSKIKKGQANGKPETVCEKVHFGIPCRNVLETLLKNPTRIPFHLYGGNANSPS